MKTEPNALAFPADNDIANLHQGLSKREYFAAMAMQGICSVFAGSEKAERQAEEVNATLSRTMAVYAVDIADELIKALNETQP